MKDITEMHNTNHILYTTLTKCIYARLLAPKKTFVGEEKTTLV